MVNVLEVSDSTSLTMQRLAGATALTGSRACTEAVRIIRERPRLMLGLLAAPLGAAGTAWLANRVPHRQTMRQRLHHARRQLGGALDLPAVAVKLLANPIIRDYLHRSVLREVSRRLGR